MLVLCNHVKAKLFQDNPVLIACLGLMQYPSGAETHRVVFLVRAVLAGEVMEGSFVPGLLGQTGCCFHRRGRLVWIYRRVNTCDSLPSPVSTPVNSWTADLRFVTKENSIPSHHRWFIRPNFRFCRLIDCLDFWKICPGRCGRVKAETSRGEASYNVSGPESSAVCWFPAVSLLASWLTEWQTMGNQNWLRFVWFSFSRPWQEGRGEKSSRVLATDWQQNKTREGDCYGSRTNTGLQTESVASSKTYHLFLLYYSLLLLNYLLFTASKFFLFILWRICFYGILFILLITFC